MPDQPPRRSTRPSRRSRGIIPNVGVHSSKGPMEHPNMLKIALGQRWSQIVRDVRAGEYTWREFVEELDQEELARCQLRASDGSFTGRPPQFVPREFVLACQRDQKRRFEEIFQKDVLRIAEEYVRLAQNEDIPAKDRAKMMQYAMERIYGGIPKDIRIAQEQPWEQLVVNVVSDDDDSMSDHHKRRYQGYQERMGGGQDEEPE